MALSLSDILAAPTDPAELKDHLVKNGLIPPPLPAPAPEPTVPPATVSPMAPLSLPSNVHPHSLDAKLIAGSMNAPNLKPLSPVKTTDSVASMEAPNLEGGGAPVGATAGVVAPMVPPARPTEKESIAAGIAQHGGTEKEEGKRQFAELRPVISAQPGTSEYLQQSLAQQEFDRTHPWGGDISAHPGTLGKIGHIAAKIGNIAGDIVAPGTMANIPGTEFNRKLTEADTARQLREKQQEESNLATADVNRQNTKSEMEKRATENKQDLVKDDQGNVTGWKDKNGALHSMDEEGTPQAIKDIADATAKKTEGPKLEKTSNGDIVQITTDKDGKATSSVVYKGDPKVETELTSRTVNGQEHHVLINKHTGEDIKDLGAFKTEKSAAENAKDEEPVIGFDKDGVQRLMPRSQAKQEGLNHVVKASPKDRADAEQNASALNDMSAKVRNAVASSKAIDGLSAYQKTLIQTALKGHPDDMSSRLAISMMAPEAKEYVQDVFSLREAALALPKQTTGGSRVSEPQANALFNTVPGSAGDHKFREGQLRKFDENLERLWRKVPMVEGNTRERAFPEQAKGGGGAGGGGGTIKMGGKELQVGADGTFEYNGHTYKTTPGSKQATLVK